MSQWVIKNKDNKEIAVAIPDQLGIKQEHCVSKWLKTIDLDIWTVPEALVMYLIDNSLIETFANLALCYVKNTDDEIKWSGESIDVDPDSISIETLSAMVVSFFTGLSAAAKKSIITYQYVSGQKITTQLISAVAQDQDQRTAKKSR